MTRRSDPTTTPPGSPEPAGSGDPASPATRPATPAGQASTEARSDEGALDLVVADTNGTPRPGVAVRIEGPSSRTVTSARDGHVRLPVPAGDYRASVVEGCNGQLRVLRGGRAELGVAVATTTTGTLVAEVAPRYEVRHPVNYDGNAGWRVGEVHTVRLRLVDPCGERPPPLSRYGLVRFEPSEGAEVVPPLSDGVSDDGFVELRMRCTTADVDLTLAMVDALDPRRRTEIFDKGLLDGQSAPFCIS
ncbi:MAG TPA: hypothetical protein VM933_00800 [Acidimicrobiales bacterium]|nr:hypothetical protein [Acidimicrobiales bacterium]